jgi:hypothetical protein
VIGADHGHEARARGHGTDAPGEPLGGALEPAPGT